MKKRKILFIINTLGAAGAETALLELMRALEDRYELYLFVLLEQGELIKRLPKSVHLLNKRCSPKDVWRHKGRLYATMLRLCLSRLSALRRLPYIIVNLSDMLKNRRVLPEKLMWRVAADGAQRFRDKKFDLAVSFIEGGSAYYTADHVNADKKAVFIHIDYKLAGYTRRLDKDCYEKFDRIFTVSDEVKAAFTGVYPEYSVKTFVFHNIIDADRIKSRADEKGGFTDNYDGLRILTVGRLTEQKAYDIAIEAMYLLKKSGVRARWYVLGEGDKRKALEKLIAERGLEEDFILCGAAENPFPYYKQCDLYVHATRYEGKSIAIREAMTLGCAVLVSDCSGNREQVTDGVDGRLCELDAQSIADSISRLISSPQERARLGAAAARRTEEASELRLLEELADG